MIISFVNQKGGVGKSTLSFHFASWLCDQGLRVSFYDGDAQRSSSTWLAASGREIPLGVIDPSNTNAMPDEIIDLARQADFTICDGPGGLGEATRTLLVLSDVALFPIQASLLDAESLFEAQQQLRYATSISPANPPIARVVLNRVKKRSRRVRATRAAEDQLGINMLGSTVRDLDAFRDAADSRTDVWHLKSSGIKAAEDLEALFHEILELLPRTELAANE